MPSRKSGVGMWAELPTRFQRSRPASSAIPPAIGSGFHLTGVFLHDSRIRAVHDGGLLLFLGDDEDGEGDDAGEGEGDDGDD